MFLDFESNNCNALLVNARGPTLAEILYKILKSVLISVIFPTDFYDFQAPEIN